MKLFTGQYEFDENGNMTYWETSDGYWEKREFDENNNRNYYENSYGKIIDNRAKEMTPLEAFKKLTSHECMTTEEFDNLVEIIKRSLLKLDSLEKFKATFDRYELAKKQDFIAYENWEECEKELKELKRDVARYFELEGNYQKSLHEYHEMEHIKNKIMKVGNEE